MRILGIDYGEVRIGLALTDPLGIFSYPLVTIMNDRNSLPEIKKIITEYNVEKIVLGYPLKENGTESNISRKVLQFKELLQKEFNLSVILVDERYSSEIAKQRILESVTSKKKRQDKKLIDKNAAAIILQDYLEQK